MRILALTVLGAATLIAAPISDLFNTGVNGPGKADPNWTIDGGTAYATDTSGFPFPHWKIIPGANWISPNVRYEGVSDPRDTTFTFRTRFTLPASFSSAQIVVSLATDNALQEVRLNGSSAGLGTTLMALAGNNYLTSVIAFGTGFSSGLGAPMTLDSGFLPGENTLEFLVRNSTVNEANEKNPTGMVALFESDVQHTPEPGTLWLTGALLLSAYGARLARKRG